MNILQDIFDMLSTAHMKLQLARHSLTKSPERSSFGHRPSKPSRQVSQVYIYIYIYAGQFFQSSLPSMSAEQVFQASLPSKGLGGRLARETCLKDVLGVIGRLAWCARKTCLEVFQASFPTKHLGGCGLPGRPSIEPGGRPSEGHEIYLYIFYIYIYLCEVLPPQRLGRQKTKVGNTRNWMASRQQGRKTKVGKTRYWTWTILDMDRRQRLGRPGSDRGRDMAESV